jgi:hypothetical protein
VTWGYHSYVRRIVLLAFVALLAGCGSHASARKPPATTTQTLPRPSESRTDLRTSTVAGSSEITYRLRGHAFSVTLPRTWTAVDSRAVLHDPAVRKLEHENPALVPNIEALRDSSRNLKLLVIAADPEATVAVTVFRREHQSIDGLRGDVLRKLRANEPVRSATVSVRPTRIAGRPALVARFKTLSHGDEQDEVYRQAIFYVPVADRLYELGITMPEDKWSRFGAAAIAAARTFKLS